jgi:hypothetical protein
MNTDQDQPSPTRFITSHQVNQANDRLVIEVTDEPGCGGANHRYDITGFDTEKNPSATRPNGYKARFSRLPIIFQNGPIGDVGVNGVTHEALLAILIDRLSAFQTGPYACQQNELALKLLVEAQYWLLDRTRTRMARGVEGTHQV